MKQKQNFINRLFFVAILLSVSVGAYGATHLAQLVEEAPAAETGEQAADSDTETSSETLIESLSSASDDASSELSAESSATIASSDSSESASSSVDEAVVSSVASSDMSVPCVQVSAVSSVGESVSSVSSESLFPLESASSSDTLSTAAEESSVVPLSFVHNFLHALVLSDDEEFAVSSTISDSSSSASSASSTSSTSSASSASSTSSASSLQPCTPSSDSAADAFDASSMFSSQASFENVSSAFTAETVPLELTPLKEQFEAKEGATFRLMDIDIPGDAAEGDAIDAETAHAAIIRNFITEDTLRNTVVQSLITEHAANIAETVLSDSATAQDIRTDLDSGASVKRSDILQQSVIDTITDNAAAQKDLTAIAVDDPAVTQAVAPLITNDLADAVATALALNGDMAEAVTSTLASVSDASSAIQTALTDAAADTTDVIIDNVTQNIATFNTASAPLLQVALTDAKGKTFTPKYHFQKGSVVLVVEPERAFTPGLYTLLVTITNPLTGEAQSFTQDFAWGVLALNADQDAYEAGDTARLDIGVLDDHGEIVCNADLRLTITPPSGQAMTLRTENDGGFLSSLLRGQLFSDEEAGITTTGSCGLKKAGFIEPDFTTNILLEEEGTYTLGLTATTANGERSTQSSITVTHDRPFTIKRTAATRLWPFAPSPMTLDVTFNQDFDGDITDIVPESFIIDSSEPEAELSTVAGTGTYITWSDVHADAGDTLTFSYIYDAPDISPEFYLMGPLILAPFDTAQGVNSFTELRNWQIANDGDGTVNIRTWDNDGGDNLWSTAANWSSDTIPDSDDIAYFDATSTADATINASFAGMIKDLKVAPAYTGTITILKNLTLSGGSVTLSGGTLSFGNAGRTLTTNGDFVMYPKAVLNAGTGTIKLSGTGASHILSGTGSYNNLTLNNGLVGYWKLDEGTGSTIAKDSSGNGNNGTLTGGPTWSNLLPSNMKFQNNRSLHFDGTNDYVNAGNVSALNGTSMFTISAWMKRNSTSEKVGLGKGNAGGSYFGTWFTGGFLHAHMAGATTATSTVANTSTSWQHVTYVFNGLNSGNAGRLKVYIDGMNQALSFSGTVPAAAPSNAISFVLGGNSYIGFFGGYMDDVRVYNRALSTSEVVRLAAGYQDTGSGTYTLGSSLDVNGSLNIVSGGLDVSASDYTANIAGNLANYGTFIRRSGTVGFDGTGNQTVSGSTVFNNLTATTVSARTIFFDYSGRQSTSGSLVIHGISGNKISLRSTRSASGAKLDLDVDTSQLAADIGYSDVKDINSGSGQALLCYTGSEECVDSGNNSNWTLTSGYKIWDGGGSTTNCSEDANWSDDLKPTTSDTVLFNATSTKNITWDASCPSTIAGFTTNSGYTGTGTLAGKLLVTGNMTLGSGTLVTAQGASGSIKVNGDMTMGRGSKIIVRYSTTTGGGSGQLISVAGNMTIGTGATITADAQGFPTGQGPGKSSSYAYGATYGGKGAGNTVSTYGSFIAPTNLGSGEGSGFGPAGAGAIVCVVGGATTVYGTVTANGGSGNSGGAGGSIYFRTSTFSGSGTIRANGGNTGAYSGGGGGRIAIVLNGLGADFSQYRGAMSTYGGSGGNGGYGAAGSIYQQTTAQGAGQGTLIVDNNNNAASPDVDTSIVSGGSWMIGHLILRNKGMLHVPIGTVLTLANDDVASTGGTGTGTLRLNGGSVVLSAGSLTMNRYTSLSVDTGSTLSGNVTIKAAANMTHSSNTTSARYKAILTVAGNFTVETGASINLNGKGYANSGPGASNSYSAGGTYGGVGGGSAPYIGQTYGSITAPTDLGSGVADVASGSNGGGALQLTVSGITNISGSVTTKGTAVNSAGAGGSIYITTASLTGNGVISANGGDRTSFSAGGGGRIAIILTEGGATFSEYAGSITAYGGSGGAGAGTVYKKTAAQTYGDLIIDNNNVSGYSTDLNGLTSTGVTVGSLTIRNAGKFLIGGNDTMTIGGNGTALLINSSASLINGNILTIGGTGATIRSGAVFTQSGSRATVNYTGQSNDADVSIGSGSYVNLGFNNPGTSFKLPSKQVYTGIRGNLTLTGGTLTTTNGQTLALSGSWINNGGAFSAGTGTVSLRGTANALTLKETSAFNNLTLNNGLVGYWKLDDGTGSTIARDSSGNGNNGTLTNGPTWSTSVPATKFGDLKSLHFDGVNDYVNIPDNSVLDPTRSITVSAWVYSTTAAGTVNWQDPISKGSAWIMRTSNNNDGHFSAYVYTPGATIVDGGVVPLNTWTLLTFTYDGARLTTYINGARTASTAVTGPISVNTNAIQINNSGQPMNGNIDDVRIYNRALSASEVARLAAGYQDTGSGTYTLGAALDVNGNLNNITGVLDASASNYGITLAGNILNVGGFTQRSGTVTLDGTGNQTLSGSTVFHNLTMTAAAARTVFFDYTGRQSASGALTLAGASTANRLKLRSTKTGSGAGLLLDGDSGTQTLSYLDVKDNNAAGGAILACSTGCLNSGNNTNWSFPWSGTVYTDEGNTHIGAGKTVALSINGGAPTTTTTDSSGNFQMTTTAPVAGDVVAIYLDNETENAALITKTDGVSLSSMDLYQNHLIVRHETGAEITTSALATAATLADTDLTDFYSTSSSNVIMALDTELYVWTGSTLHPGGTLAPDDLDVRGSLRMGGKTLSVSGSARTRIGSVTQTGTTIFDSAFSEFLAFSGSTLATLNLTGGGIYTASGTLAVNSGLRIQAGTLNLSGSRLNTTSATFRNDGALALKGNEVLTGFTNDTSSGTIVFVGPSSYTGLDGMTSFRHLSFSGAGTWTLNAALTVNGTLTLSGGTLDISASNYGITTKSFIARSSAQFNPRRGIVTFNGTGSIMSNRAFSGVLLNARGKTLTLGASMLVSGNLTLSGGTLKVPNAATYALTLSGTLLKKSFGSLSAGSGTVILDSGASQTLSGSTTFYNLTKQVSVASNLYLAATATQTVAHTLTLNGAAGQNLTLRSTIAGAQAKLDPQGTRTLQYLTPTDNNNINASLVLCSNDCVNGGGNTNWAFPISVTVYDSEGNIVGAGVTVSIAVNGSGGTIETAVTGSDGAATFINTSVQSGDIVTAWIDGETENGVNISKTNGTSLGFTIYEDTVQVTNEAGSSITFSDIGTGTLISDSDIADLITTDYSAGSGHTITMTDLSTLRIKTDSTLEATGEADVYTVDINGQFNMGDWTHTVRGSFDATGGSFTTTGNVVFQTDRPQTITSNGSTFHDVTFAIPHEGADGTWVATDELTITSTQTITITNDVSSFNGPNISNISVTASDVEAVINWYTSQLATTKLFMGTSTGSLIEVVNDSGMEYDHSETVSDLTPSTKYYYQIVAVNNINQTTTGSVFSFNTLSEQITQADLDAAAASGGGGGSTTPNTCTVRWFEISNLVVVPKADGTATVTWDTNAAGVSMVNYGIDALTESFASDLTNFTREHSLSLSSLKKGATYKLKAISLDKCGNVAESEEMSFTVPGTADETSSASPSSEGSSEQATTENVATLQDRLKGLLEKLSQNVSLQEFKNTLRSQSELLDSLADKIPGPVLGGEPKVVPTDTTATITWSTDELADSHISFAPDSLFSQDSYTASVDGENSQATDHSVTLRGLTPGTLYHYQVKSQTPFGTSTVSRDFTFTTNQELITVINYSIEVISKRSARFVWSTNVPTTSVVTQTPYRNNILDREGAESMKDEILALRHSVVLDNLEPGVVYDIELSGKNAAGIIVSKVLARFTTSPEEAAPEISQVQTDAAIVPGKDAKIQTVVSWQTNEQATGRVWYQKGVNTDPTQPLQESTTLDTNYTRKHVVLLPSLEPGEIYSFRVESIDSGGNLTLSKTYTILTPRQQEGIIQIIFKQMEDAFGWLKDLRG